MISCFLLSNSSLDLIIYSQTSFVITGFVFFSLSKSFSDVFQVFSYFQLLFLAVFPRGETDKAMMFVCVFFSSLFYFLNVLANLRQIWQEGREFRDVQRLQVSWKFICGFRKEV